MTRTHLLVLTAIAALIAGTARAVPVINEIDANVYGSASNPLDPELLTTLGQSTQYVDTDTTSISRVPDISGPFTNNTTPTPQNSGVPQVPEPATVFVLLQVLGISTVVGAS